MLYVLYIYYLLCTYLMFFKLFYIPDVLTACWKCGDMIFIVEWLNTFMIYVVSCCCLCGLDIEILSYDGSHVFWWVCVRRKLEILVSCKRKQSGYHLPRVKMVEGCYVVGLKGTSKHSVKLVKGRWVIATLDKNTERVNV